MGVIYKNGIAYSGDTAEMTGATSSAAGKSGLVPTPAAGDQKKFLKADGTWSTPDGKYLVQSGIVYTFTDGKMIVNFPTTFKKVLGFSVIPTVGTAYLCTLGNLYNSGFEIKVWNALATDYVSAQVTSSASVRWMAIGEV